MAGAQYRGGEDPEPEVSSVRPYLLTGGRARPLDVTLEAEAQAVTTASGRSALTRLADEYRDIVALCQQPTSVAEIAAHLDLHLAVARVLVGDLAALGHVTVRRPEANGRRQAKIIERVIDGLQSIS